MSQIITTNQSTTMANMFDISASNESFLVLPGVVLTAVGYNIFSSTSGASDLRISLFGMLAALDAPAVMLNGVRPSIIIAEGAQLFVDATSQAAITLMGTDASLSNSGSITANGTYAIWLAQTGSNLVNWGSISGQKSAVLTDGAGSVVLNYGTITGAGTATSGTTYALHTRFGSQVVKNFGTMTAVGPGGAEVIHVASSGLQINNYGMMATGGGWVIGGILGAGTILRNWGTIAGDDPGSGAVQLDSLDNTLFNRGLIVGTIELGEGNDVLDTRNGQIEGEVYGGAGDDTYFVSRADLTLIEYANDGFDTLRSTVSIDMADFSEIEQLELRGAEAIMGIGTDEANVIIGFAAANAIFGHHGQDYLSGGGGNDTIDGGLDTDTLLGGTGDDVIIADGGYDQIFGGAGNDSLFGGTGNDRAEGGDGDDVLAGDAGIDKLYGGGGADTLRGGASRDSLYGGSDEDVFQFRLVTDSGAGSGARDVIFDFASGVDVIDVAEIDADRTTASGDQAFFWIDTATFSNQAGEMRWQQQGGNVLLAADTDGDGLADFEILLNGLTGFNVNDLIL